MMKKLLFLLPILAFLFATGCERIDTGSVGVESVMGQYKIEELAPGVYWTLFKRVDEFTAKQVVVSLQDLKAQSRDRLVMTDYDVDVFYRVTPNKVADLVVKYRGDVETFQGDYVAAYNRVARSAREAAYRAASLHDSLNMHTEREALATEIKKFLQADLDSEDPQTFTVTDINIRALVPDPKLASTSLANAEMQNRIEQKNKEIELARKENDRLKVEAEGKARANLIEAASLTPQLLRLREIEAQRAFATAGTHTVLMGGTGHALVNVGK